MKVNIKNKTNKKTPTHPPQQQQKKGKQNQTKHHIFKHYLLF